MQTIPETRYLHTLIFRGASPPNNDTYRILTPVREQRLNLDIKQCPPILENCIIAVSDDFGSTMKRDILLHCKMLGAKVKQNFSEECTHLISRYQKGEAYDKVSSFFSTHLIH